MRERKLLKYLVNAAGPVDRSLLQKSMGLSEPTIRRIIQDINDSKEIGAAVQYRRKEGYVLIVKDKEQFDLFLQSEEEEVDIYNQDDRRELLLFYLLQAHGYMTIQDLIDKTQLSRSTIAKELKKIQEKLSAYHLTLETKAHYGIRIEGNEENIRKAFSRYVLHNVLALAVTVEYGEFRQQFPARQIQDKLEEIIRKNDLQINTVMKTNFLLHLELAAFRVQQNNLICLRTEEMEKTDPIFHESVREILEYLEEIMGLYFPQPEREFLSVGLSAIAKRSAYEQVQDSQIKGRILAMLKELEGEFMMDFSSDNDLVEALKAHLILLLNRLHYGFQLHNPIIEQIYIQFSGVFLIACRFAELAERTFGCHKMSRDEIGLLALHFGTYLERRLNRRMQSVRRIGIICEMFDGKVSLLQARLETVFPNASINTVSLSKYKENLIDEPDFFVEIGIQEELPKTVPTVRIHDFLGEREIQRIKEFIMLQYTEPNSQDVILQMENLFSEKYFQIIEEGEYLEIIREQAVRMTEEGDADAEFVQDVFKREYKFTTIYANGVAAPHAMHLKAKKDTIGVTILKRPIMYQGKEVRYIFLLNLKKNHLFLQEEISQLLVKIVENGGIRSRLDSCAGFEMFQRLIQEIL